MKLKGIKFNWSNVLKVCDEHMMSINHFLSFISKLERDGDCVYWTGAKYQQNYNNPNRKLEYYGVFGWQKVGTTSTKTRPSHRLLQEFLLGRILKTEEHIRHIKRKKCKKGTLCAIHCKVGTRKKNGADMVMDLNQNNQILKPEEALDIYHRAWKLEPQKDIAADYDIKHNHVSEIKHGRLWSHLTGHERE